MHNYFCISGLCLVMFYPQVLENHRVHFGLRAAIAKGEFLSLAGFVELYVSKEDVNAKVPKELDYAPANPDDPQLEEQKKLRLYNVRLSQAWETAGIRLKEVKETCAKRDAGGQPCLGLVV